MLPVTPGKTGIASVRMAVELRNLLEGCWRRVDGMGDSRAMNQEMANRRMMCSKRTSGFHVSAQLASRRCIAILGLCLVISCATRGGLVAVAQQPATPVTSIESLVRSKNYDQALQLTKAQLHTKPTDVRLWTLEGIIYSLTGKNTDARTAFEKALRLSPNYMPALKGEVQLLYESSDKQGIPLLERILKADSQDLTAQEMLAMLLKKQGDCRAANEHFAISSVQMGAHPETLEAYGYCLVQMKEYEKAIAVFEGLAALLPERDYPEYDLAVVLVTTNQNEAALKVLAPLLTDNQQDPDILSVASQAYEATGDTPKAVSLLRRAIVMSPKTASYYVMFSEICLTHDSFQVGIDMINAGLQRIPDDSSLYISRGILYAQLAQYDKAEADFKRVEQLDSAQSISAYAGDLTDVLKNNPDQALAKVRTQLQALPEDPLLNYLLAQLLMNQAPAVDSEAFKEAMKSALLAVKLKPDHVGARDLLASMYMKTSQYDLAIEQCQIALKYSPSDESATYHLIISMRHTGHTDDLKPLVKRLAELHQESLQHETERKRYRLVVEPEPPK
jgi:tetratricopeptide (TPR) repeat protein